MSSLLLKLLIAHVLGDFVFQPAHWVADKEQRKHRSKFLYYHIGIHLLALITALGFDLNYLPALAIILVSHYLIDLSKLFLRNRVHSGLLFALDQLAHVGVILGVVHFYEPFNFNIGELCSDESLLFLLALITVSFVCAIVMKLIMSRWSLEDISPNDSLAEAGKYIGMLERLFVFGFIVLGQWQAIGFLLAAKSVFRFGDLSKAKDRKLTEYILIGTLLSFGLAISIGLAFQYALAQL